VKHSAASHTIHTTMWQHGHQHASATEQYQAPAQLKGHAMQCEACRPHGGGAA
jgi:hypothetical protein